MVAGAGAVFSGSLLLSHLCNQGLVQSLGELAVVLGVDARDRQDSVEVLVQQLPTPLYYFPSRRCDGDETLASMLLNSSPCGHVRFC